MRAYLRLLREERNFALLSLVQLMCYFGVWFSHTGIFTLLIKLDAPVWALTTAAAMAYAPCVVLAPFSGVLVDKFSPRPMLFVMAAIEALTVFMLVFIDTLELLWLLLVLIFVRNGTGAVYFQVEMSLLPKILTAKKLKLANEIHSIIWAVAYTAGMGLAGVYIHIFGIKSAFVFDGLIYICSFYFLFLLRLPKFVPPAAQSALKMMREGLVYLRQNPLLVHLILLHAFVGLTAYDALVALLADYQYAKLLSASLIIGYINGCRALALIIGPAVLSRFVTQNTLAYVYIGHGMGVLAWAGLQFSFYAGFVGLLAAGFFTSTLWSYTYTLIQQNCEAKFYGRVIAYNDMIFLGVSTLASLAIGWFFDSGVSLNAITAGLGAMFFVGAGYYIWVKNRYEIK